MKISEIQALLKARVYSGEEFLEEEVRSACGCDLMSDALAFPKERMVLLTGLTNPHAVRTAEMLDVRCIVFVRGKQPTPEMTEMAKERDIVLLATQYTLYVASGILYRHGLPGDSRGM